MKTVALSFLAALALAVGACSGTMSCQDICKEQNACPGASMRDCNAFCTLVSNLDAAGNCGAKDDEWRTCESTIVICSPSTVSCESDRNAWTECASTYCDAHPTEANCMAGTPAL